MTKQRVLIAMSGGVDSTAAALMLQRSGYHVDGVMLHLHSEADESAEQDARAAAERLGIGFTLLDGQAAFRRPSSPSPPALNLSQHQGLF